MNFDPNLPVDQQHVDESDCPHVSDYWFMDYESGKWFCRLCDKEKYEENQEPADFSGASDEPGFAPDR